MKDFIDRNCVPCKGGIPPLNEEEVTKRMEQLERWKAVNNHHLQRSLKFKDFQSALDFVNQVGQVAEQENHHPEICFTWGKVVIRIWTHKIDGLHDNDFILAAKINNLF
ncbi:4a-hydroxytetrahydrobiopterin dehydratase [Carboxylicivirga linearis]|uniref:Putative pterin-4-alpha-carbinolamine dehydratase n=1 Tax=Carboxylicivirga linearis TaxID=1628157 RepID=A0ABS5JWZ5_9BACT|nr:4a-hydroxytetrahydrobiopterin dehydratase [Carboxylicivirga linearis]MBS2099408.1 4a-hydroxytetrahydrobiopterin dehydratase [Carboxylicivirga linearis]